MDDAPRPAGPGSPSALARLLGDLHPDALLALAVALHGDVRGAGDVSLARAEGLAELIAGAGLDLEARVELATGAVRALDDLAPAVAEVIALWLDRRAAVPAGLGRARARSEAWVREVASTVEIETMLMACFNALPRRRRVAFLAAAQAHVEAEQRPREE